MFCALASSSRHACVNPHGAATCKDNMLIAVTFAPIEIGHTCVDHAFQETRACSPLLH